MTTCGLHAANRGGNNGMFLVKLQCGLVVTTTVQFKFKAITPYGIKVVSLSDNSINIEQSHRPVARLDSGIKWKASHP